MEFEELYKMMTEGDEKITQEECDAVAELDKKIVALNPAVGIEYALLRRIVYYAHKCHEMNTNIKAGAKLSDCILLPSEKQELDETLVSCVEVFSAIAVSMLEFVEKQNIRKKTFRSSPDKNTSHLN